MRLILILSSVFSLVIATGCDDKNAAVKSGKDVVAPASQPKTSKAGQPSTAKAASTASDKSSDKSSDKGTDPKDRGQIDADGVVRRGSTLTTTTSMSVPAVFGKAKELAGKTVKVTGTVDQVCANKGCWMVIRGEDKTIRITSKGYKFFVPKDAKGKKATIEGDLAVKQMTKEEAQHFEDDAAAASGKPAKQVTSGHVEIQIAAVALELS